MNRIFYFLCTKDLELYHDGDKVRYSFNEGEIYISIDDDSEWSEGFNCKKDTFWICSHKTRDPKSIYFTVERSATRYYGCRFSKIGLRVIECVPYEWYFEYLDTKKLRKMKMNKMFSESSV